MARKFGEKLPAFYRFVDPETYSDRLKIPEAHYWHRQRRYPEKVTIINECGNSWPVKVERVENQLCFTEGWVEFVAENNVQVGNFLVFESISSSELSVFVLEATTSRMKKRVGNTQYRDIGEEENVVDGEETEEGVWEEKYLEGSFEDEDEEEDGGYEPEEECLKHNSPTKMPKRNAAGKKTQQLQHKKKRMGEHTSSSRIPKDAYENEIFKSGSVRRPSNPYFITYKRTKREGQLFIPHNVIKDYNLQLPGKTVIRDTQGREWATNLARWRDGRVWYHGGWDSFCRVNYVEEDDTCICEIVEEKDGKGLYLYAYKS